MIVYIGGIGGVGKTTLIKQAKELAGRKQFRLEVVNEKEILCELARVVSIEELRNVSEEVKRSIYPEMNRRIHAFDRHDPTTIRLRDAHFIYFNHQTRIYEVRPLEPGDEKQILSIAVVTAEPEFIMQRRRENFTARPDRRLIDLNTVIDDQDVETNTALSWSEKFSVPIRVFINEQGWLTRTSAALLSFIEDCVKKRG